MLVQAAKWVGLVAALGVAVAVTARAATYTEVVCVNGGVIVKLGPMTFEDAVNDLSQRITACYNHSEAVIGDLRGRIDDLTARVNELERGK